VESSAAEPPLGPRSGPVRRARRLSRRASRLSARRFLVEGPQALREALAVPGCVDEVFATGPASARHAGLRRQAEEQDVAWRPASDDVVRALAETVTPQGLVGVCRFVDVPLDRALGDRPRLVAVCVDVRDPGNAGTVIRCADTAGADAVVLAGASVDPYNGKAVRASAGSLFHLPVTFGVDTATVVEVLRSRGVAVLAALGGADASLDDLLDDGLLPRPTAWLFGNEAHGLSAAEEALADRRVRVPIYGRAESLNLATAAAVCLYASARAQRHGSSGRSSTA